MNPGSVDSLPGVSLEDLLKEAGVYDDYMNLLKNNKDGSEI
jgi:hypothetical protein